MTQASNLKITFLIRILFGLFHRRNQAFHNLLVFQKLYATKIRDTMPIFKQVGCLQLWCFSFADRDWLKEQGFLQQSYVTRHIILISYVRMWLHWLSISISELVDISSFRDHCSYDESFRCILH